MNAGEFLTAAVIAKVEDWNIKAAIRVLCSEEKLASDVKASYEELLKRHPDPPFDRGPAQPPDDIPAIQVSEADVLSAIRFFLLALQAVPKLPIEFVLSKSWTWLVVRSLGQFSSHL